MRITVKNVEYFEWNVPEELVDLMKDHQTDPQDLVDSYFDPQHLTVAQCGDTYYEAEGVIDE